MIVVAILRRLRPQAEVIGQAADSSLDKRMTLRRRDRRSSTNGGRDPRCLLVAAAAQPALAVDQS